MTIVTITETPNALALSAFTQGGEVLATNYFVDFKGETFNGMVKMIGTYLRQYARQEGPSVIVAMHKEASQLMQFVAAEVQAMGGIMLVTEGQNHQEMATKVSDALAAEMEKQAKLQQEQMDEAHKRQEEMAQAEAQAAEEATPPAQEREENESIPVVEAEEVFDK